MPPPEKFSYPFDNIACAEPFDYAPEDRSHHLNDFATSNAKDEIVATDFVRQRSGQCRGFSPPVAFITVAMNLAMMASAECHDPLVADLSAKCAALREAQMMRIRRGPAADKARLGRDKS